MIKYFIISILLCSPTLYAQSSSRDSKPWDNATVYRDEWGVPHIYANNPRSMAYTFGYTQAEDHLEDMLRAYRVASGRASEVYGKSFIQSDKHALVMRHYDLAKVAYQDIDPLTRNLCEGFSSGVNTWILEHPDEVPLWAEGVSPVDVLALLHHYLTTMAPLDYDDGYVPAKGTPIGNAWALDASRTQKGNPILVMNPHTDYDGIFQWYEAHLVTRDMNMYGATIFGLPVLLMGHNQRLGWALSPNEADTADVYAIHNESIPYSNESDQHPLFVWENKSLKEYTIDRMMTYYGPVIGYRNGIPYTYRIGGYRDFGGLRQLYDMGRARNLKEFLKAWDRQQLPVFHVVYADRFNNIFYNYNAKVGDKSFLFDNREDTPRLSKTKWESPMSSETPGAQWGEDLSIVDDLPWIRNPKSGYIQASGTPPWLVTEGMGWDEDDFDDWLIRDADSYRAKRLRQLFSKGKRSFTDNQAILYDIVVPLAAETVPYILKAAENNPSYVNQANSDLQSVINLLKNWDYQAHTDSEAMTFFHVWWTLYSREFEQQATATETLHSMLLDSSPTMQKYILMSAAHAAQLMNDYYQTVHVPWGEVHVIKRGNRSFPIAGSYTGEPLFGTGDQYFKRGKWIVKQGPAFTMAVEFTKSPKAASALPFGTSENPNSEHYDDQLPLMRERRLKHTRFKRSDVEQHAVSATGKAISLRRGNSGTSLLVRASKPVTVTLGLSTDLDIEMPTGYASFSPYIEPVALPLNVPIENTLEIHIPSSLCTQDTVDLLRVYSYSPYNGWKLVQDQEIDWKNRTLYAWGYDREVYAVLGPEDLLLGDVSKELYHDFSPTLSKLASATSPTKNSSSFLQALPNPLSDEERERIAQARPAPNPFTGSFLPDVLPYETYTKHTFTGLKNYKNPLSGVMHEGILSPAAPPGWEGFLRNQQYFYEKLAFSNQPVRLPPMQTMINSDRPRSDESSSSTDPALPSPEQLTMFNSAEQDSTPFQDQSPESSPTLSSEITSEPLESAAAQIPLAPLPDAPKNLEELTSIKTNKSRRDKAEDNNPFRDSKKKVLFNEGLPQSLTPVDPNRGVPKIVLAPIPDLATNLIVDKEINFPFPRFDAEFNLSMDNTVRAQMAFRPAPAEPYPNQLVPFSPLFEVFYDSNDVKGVISISMRVKPEVCAREDFDQLTLYAYGADGGWAPVDRQKKNLDHMSIITLDFNIRSYVILGPKAVRIAPPKMVP